VQTVSPGFTDALVLNQASYFEPWRFLTSIFLHGGFAHLLYNLFALALFGSILERLIGGKNFLAVFFLSGLLANFIAVNFYSSSLGASGAIYGILGCLTVIKPRMTVWVYSLPMPMFLATIVWTIGSILGIFYPDNTGHIAHLSGIIVGLLFGFFIRSRIPRKVSYTRKINIPEDYMREWERTHMGVKY